VDQLVSVNSPNSLLGATKGSVTALTDQDGAAVESCRYVVFGTVSAHDSSGNPLAGAPATGNRFLHAGRERGRRRRGHMDDARSVSPEGRGRDGVRPSPWVAEAGFCGYRNRLYSPVLGRFLQNDPIWFEAGDVTKSTDAEFPDAKRNIGKWI